MVMHDSRHRRFTMQINTRYDKDCLPVFFAITTGFSSHTNTRTGQLRSSVLAQMTTSLYQALTSFTNNVLHCPLTPVWLSDPRMRRLFQARSSASPQRLVRRQPTRVRFLSVFCTRSSPGVDYITYIAYVQVFISRGDDVYCFRDSNIPLIYSYTSWQDPAASWYGQTSN